MGAEQDRVAGFGKLQDGLRQASDWYLWGPYVSERQWGTVREDYSADGQAWDYFPHDQARSRAYRWGDSARWRCFTSTGDVLRAIPKGAQP